MSNSLKPIEQPVSLMEVTVDRIRDAIISGDLPLGCKLSEQRLADMLGISRSPVRDALAALQVEGLVTISPKRGSFVFTPDLKAVDEISEHRCILEKASIRKAIATNHPALLKRLADACGKMTEASRLEDALKYTKGDIDFHNSIIISGGNHSIASSYKRTIGPLMALRTHLFTIMNETLDRSMGEHLAVLEACRSKDVTGAEKLIDVHATHLVDAYRRALSETTLFDGLSTTAA
ncbi:GntR family transcriptional regulator [Hoeflea alexandrii]|uniref:FCD domain-containing protein n=1 Tax=Hoeflea alexandrii TaxID=288436 RepID=A0ABT1CTD2_9HYPH|nr:GntR family transcriptional regulator [Hoeflea alexandrii]MCO6409454.1 FCD domain-containing protein [Hoeflea alexandrii]MCY0152043.1 GntR family transcriptional regulator [Hoeflea alexandrii]